MKAILFVFLALPLTSLAQTMEATPQEEVGIMQAVDNLFEALKKADPEAVKGAFSSNATLQTVSNTAGFVTVKSESIADFAASVGKAKPGEMNEVIQPYQIQIDGDLATTFIPYKFVYKGKEGHCGANAITLVRFNGEWKIQAIIDTRRPCL